MNIQVIGSGCQTCKQLFELTKQVVEEMELKTQVEYITDVSKLIELGVMTSPVLAIDDKPVLTGGGKSAEDIKKALEENTPQGNTSCGECSCGGNC